MAKKITFNVYSAIPYKGILKLAIPASCNKFSTKNYSEFNLVFISLIPFSICVPAYSGIYFSIWKEKYFFHAIYIVYNPMSKLYESVWDKRIKFEIRKLCTLEKFVK